MYKTSLRGDYYQLGYKYGRILKRVGFKPPKQTSEKLKMGRKCEEEIKKHFPQIIEEIKGVVNAAEFDYGDFVAFLLTLTLNPSCTCFAVGGDATESGRTIFARNYDMFYRFKKTCETYRTYPKGGYASIGNTDIFIGRQDGLNENGLAVGDASVVCIGFQPGFIFPIIVRALLDTCSSVDEAIEFVQRIPHARSFHYLIADKSGKIAAVEATINRVNIRQPRDGLVVITNHFQSEMRRYEILEERPPDSEPRLNKVKSWFKEKGGSINLESTIEILKGHEKGVCSHVKPIQLGTLWSMVAELDRKEVLIADGHPCRAKYRTYQF